MNGFDFKMKRVEVEQDKIVSKYLKDMTINWLFALIIFGLSTWVLIVFSSRLLEKELSSLQIILGVVVFVILFLMMLKFKFIAGDIEYRITNDFQESFLKIFKLSRDTPELRNDIADELRGSGLIVNGFYRFEYMLETYTKVKVDKEKKKELKEKLKLIEPVINKAYNEFYKNSKGDIFIKAKVNLRRDMDIIVR